MLTAGTTQYNSRMSDKNPSAAATSNGDKKKRSSKVSFSDEVISKDKMGDGSKVLVEEEHGVFLSLLGQKRVVVATNDDGNDSLPERIATISFGGDDDADNDDLLKQKLAYSEKQVGNIVLQSGKNAAAESNRGGTKDGVEYENLVVKIGLLKIGHRYRMILPIPSNHWEQQDEKHTHDNDEVKIIEDSFDDDLRGEIETEHSNNASSQHYLNIALSAKRRGPYRGRFVLELSRYPLATAVNNATLQKCIMSVQVDATIMGKDMGTPKLRNGVICLGKIVGYDSDDETEWQGFD